MGKIIDLYEEGFGIRSTVHLLAKENIDLSHMTVYRYLVSRGKIMPRHSLRFLTYNLVAIFIITLQTFGLARHIYHQLGHLPPFLLERSPRSHEE